MPEQFIAILNKILIFDLIFIVLIILSLIKCTSKGFVLSLLYVSRWLVGYILTLFLFPKVKPYFKGLLDSEYALDITIGTTFTITLSCNSIDPKYNTIVTNVNQAVSVTTVGPVKGELVIPESGQSSEGSVYTYLSKLSMFLK